MLAYSTLWGSISSGVALAIPIWGIGGLGYALLFGLVGIVHGLLIGAITGLIIGIFTCAFYSPPRHTKQYKVWLGIGFVILFATCKFFIAPAQFLAPLPPGAQYSNPLQTLIFAVLIPSLIMGLLSFPVSQRLASWYITTDASIRNSRQPVQNSDPS
jgi:hypothetical protein